MSKLITLSIFIIFYPGCSITAQKEMRCYFGEKKEPPKTSHQNIINNRYNKIDDRSVLLSTPPIKKRKITDFEDCIYLGPAIYKVYLSDLKVVEILCKNLSSCDLDPIESKNVIDKKFLIIPFFLCANFSKNAGKYNYINKPDILYNKDILNIISLYFGTFLNVYDEHENYFIDYFKNDTISYNYIKCIGNGVHSPKMIRAKLVNTAFAKFLDNTNTDNRLYSNDLDIEKLELLFSFPLLGPLYINKNLKEKIPIPLNSYPDNILSKQGGKFSETKGAVGRYYRYLSNDMIELHGCLWSRMKPGLNLRGICKNKNCCCYDKVAWSNLGFDYGISFWGDKNKYFDLSTIIVESVCSQCNAILPRRSIEKIGLYKCSYHILGKSLYTRFDKKEEALLPHILDIKGLVFANIKVEPVDYNRVM